MKIIQLFEQAPIILDAATLRKEAEAAGHKLFDSHRSGLIFSGDIKVVSIKKYRSYNEGNYDTFDYVFKPKPIDLADDEVKESHAVAGVIYVAGADGITLITLPGVKVKVSGDMKEPEEPAEGATWRVWDRAGYQYTVEPKHGVAPLSHDHDEALHQLKTGRYGFGAIGVMRIEKVNK